jgi:hypothetical protein
MCRYTALGHLGPFEDPAYVADRVVFSLHFSERPAAWKTLPKAEVVRAPRGRL